MKARNLLLQWLEHYRWAMVAARERKDAEQYTRLHRAASRVRRNLRIQERRDAR